jgi:hypothetical protein
MVPHEAFQCDCFPLAPGKKRRRVQNQSAQRADACFDRPAALGGEDPCEPAPRFVPRLRIPRSPSRARLTHPYLEGVYVPYPHWLEAHLQFGTLRTAYQIPGTRRLPQKEQPRLSNLPHSKHPRSRASGHLARPSISERGAAPMLPRPLSSIGNGGIVLPRLCTSAPLQRVRRLSPANARARMPPWHRGYVRKVPPAVLERRCLLSPCGCAPVFAASLPLPSIVAATRRATKMSIGREFVECRLHGLPRFSR